MLQALVAMREHEQGAFTWLTPDRNVDPIDQPMRRYGGEPFGAARFTTGLIPFFALYLVQFCSFWQVQLPHANGSNQCNYGACRETLESVGGRHPR
jgi:hypothetical protein